MQKYLQCVVAVCILQAFTPCGYAQRGAAAVEELSKIAKYVSIGAASGTVFRWIAPPTITDKLSIGSRESMFSKKLVLSLSSKSTDPITNVIINYSVSGKEKKFEVGTVQPGQSKEFGWMQGAPMLQTGDSITISSDGTRSATFHF